MHTSDNYTFASFPLKKHGQPMALTELESRGIYWLKMDDENYVFLYLPTCALYDIHDSNTMRVAQAGNVSYVQTTRAYMKFITVSGHAVMVPVDELAENLYPVTGGELAHCLSLVRCAKKYEDSKHRILRCAMRRLSVEK